MPDASPPSTRAAGALLTALLTFIAAAILIQAPERAAGASTGQLQQQIASGQGQVSALSGVVRSAGARADSLAGAASSLQAQVDRLQADLVAKRYDLLRLRGGLVAARARLVELETAEKHADAVLSEQLVGSYEGPRPDLVGVVLESTGFSNLLERLAFARRVGDSDAEIVAQVRASRRAVAAAATRLGTLAERQQQLTTQVVIDRDRVQRARVALVSQQIVAARSRDEAAGRLASARQSVSALRGQLAKLQAAEAAQAARAARAAQAASAPPSSSGSTASESGPAGAAPINRGSGAGDSSSTSSSGGFTFPLPRSAVAPPGTWSLDDGVDMAAPGGTPEYAVCSGTIVLHGIGGFGPSAPVLHCDASLDGYQYVYYGHAGPGNWTPVGTHVSAGQAISEIGSGIVGISTGPHVEMGFADSSGSPIGPSSAATMSALLHAAYNG